MIWTKVRVADLQPSPFLKTVQIKKITLVHNKKEMNLDQIEINVFKNLQTPTVSGTTTLDNVITHYVKYNEDIKTVSAKFIDKSTKEYSS